MMPDEPQKPLTPKQEAFCHAYVETGNASEAYRRSYNAQNMKQEVIAVKACELLASGNVSVRVKELRGFHLERHKVTIDDLIAELEEARIAAVSVDRPQAAAMVAATMGKARILGLEAPQKLEHTGKDGGPMRVAREMTDDDLEAIARGAGVKPPEDE